MLDLDDLSDGTSLLSWNSELPSSSTGDPLGMTLRIGARLGAELLHCITSITPRARYYSFFPWAFARARDRLGADANLSDMMRLVLIDERAMVLGAVLHHDGQTCEGGGLQGSNKAIDDVADGLQRTTDLAGWTHLRGSVSGFEAYKGSLINLGVFEGTSGEEEDTAEDSEDSSSSITPGALSPFGHRLADAFAMSVTESLYVTRKKSSAEVETAVLGEFGRAAGLCELRDADGFDLEPLRDLFFAVSVRADQNPHHRRRLTLLLLLWATDASAERKSELDEWSFADLTFYNVFFDEQDEAESVDIPVELRDISERWRIFQFHSYLTAALEGLLAGLVREIRNSPSGRNISEILESFDTDTARAELTDYLVEPIQGNFLDATPAGSLALLGIDFSNSASEEIDVNDVFTKCPFIERELRDALIDDELFSSPSGPILCTLLLYALLLRYELSVNANHKGWNVQKVFNPLGDVGMPTICNSLKSDFGKDWWNVTNRQILHRVLDRHVVRQHETMSYEKGFGGSPPFFRVEGMSIVGTDVTCDAIGASNPRFPSAIQILWDLRLVNTTEDGFQELSADGLNLLRQQLARASV